VLDQDRSLSVRFLGSEPLLNDDCRSEASRRRKNAISNTSGSHCLLLGVFCCLSSPVVVVWAPCEIEAENNNLLRAARFFIAQQDRHEGTKVRT